MKLKFKLDCQIYYLKVEIEESDKTLRETMKMASDNEQKLDELTRKLGVQVKNIKSFLKMAFHYPKRKIRRKNVEELMRERSTQIQSLKNSNRCD
jgi:hypothetical protein